MLRLMNDFPAASFSDSRVITARTICVYGVGLCDSDLIIVSQLGVEFVHVIVGCWPRRFRGLGTPVLTGRGGSAEVSGGTVRRMGF